MLDEAVRAKVAPYVSSLTDDVFALSGLPEEVIAVLFAYYSRSRDDLRTNLAKLLADEDLDVTAGAAPRHALAIASEKARAFHEKWVVGYGHASVAEHAVVHLALENVSIVASKVIEDLRLGSYTEKSTRYVVFDRHSFVTPPGLAGAARDHYRASGERLFGAYLDLMPKVMDALRERFPRPAGTSEAAHTAAIRGQACDLLRGLLPAGTRTNIGLTANARALEMLLSKMMSHPLGEVQELAERMLGAARHVVPTLVKYAARNPYRAGLGGAVRGAMNELSRTLAEDDGATIPPAAPVRLMRFDADALERVALALAYEGSDPDGDAVTLTDALRRAGDAPRLSVIRTALALRGPHDPVPRGFEASSMTFELTLDYGAYRDLQRHRMLTPATQRLSCRLGYETPTELADLGFGAAYEAAMDAARATWMRLEAPHPLEAQYAVPLGYVVRTLWTLNLRELFHVIELRSGKQGHLSYRRVAQGLYRATCEALPWLRDLVRVDLNAYTLARG